MIAGYIFIKAGMAKYNSISRNPQSFMTATIVLLCGLKINATLHNLQHSSPQTKIQHRINQSKYLQTLKIICFAHIYIA